jgi:hypothetical protein
VKKLFSPANLALYAMFSVALLVFISGGCDKGLTPPPPPPAAPPELRDSITGFGGVISFRNWPPLDSVDQQVQELRLVAFKNPPIDTSGLIIEFLRGNVLVFPRIGTTAYSKRDSSGRLRDTIRYSIEFTPGVDSLPFTYSYIAIAWRYGTNFFADWRPAGLYTTQPGTFIPGAITVREYRYLRNIDVNCDFRNPPPIPWRR